MNHHTPTQPQPTASLTSIGEAPTADIVIYDGRCVFCTHGVRQLQWLDGKQRLAFLSLHDAIVEQRFPDLSYEQLMEQMFVVPQAQPTARFGGATAIRYLSRRLPKLWVFAPLLHLPFTLPLWQWLYRCVARIRYRIANKSNSAECDENGTCELHQKKN